MIASRAKDLRQLPLPFAHLPSFTAAEFLAAPSNEAAITWLARVPDWPQGRLALWGDAGRGKTHLLRIWSARHGAEILDGATLPPEPAAPAGPTAVDDADMAPEHALLHLLNMAAEAGCPVLLAARAAPARWAAGLPDLASRLRAITGVEIGLPEEELLRILLARLLAERQIAVAEPVQDWLRLRLPRTAAAMREAAVRLDRAGLAAGRRIDRAMAAAAVADMAAQGGTAHEDLARGATQDGTTPRLL